MFNTSWGSDDVMSLLLFNAKFGMKSYKPYLPHKPYLPN